MPAFDACTVTTVEREVGRNLAGISAPEGEALHPVAGAHLGKGTVVRERRFLLALPSVPAKGCRYVRR